VTRATAEVANDVSGAVAPADDRADRDGDREIERAELGKRAPFPQARADNGDREEQDSLDRHPSQIARATDQFRHLRHLLPSSPARCRTCVHAVTTAYRVTASARRD